jgi:TRAP-type mannitol/chloroaromatic compound transport system permease small subunit
MERLSAPLDLIARRTGRMALYLVMLMALTQFAIVILRYVFGLNFIAMQESVTYMHGAVFLLAGGYALLTDDHVRVDILYRNAAPRKKAVIDLAGTYLFLFPFCLVGLWAAGPYVANSWAVREGSMEQSGIKGVFLLKSLIPTYLTLLACAGFVVAARAVATLKSRSV